MAWLAPGWLLYGERENIFEKVEKEKKTHTKTSHQSGVSGF